MTRHLLWTALLIAALCLAGCPQDNNTEPDGPNPEQDASPDPEDVPAMEDAPEDVPPDEPDPEDVAPDTTPEDEPQVDASPDPNPDMGDEVPLEGFGEIEGECGVLGDAELSGMASGFYLNRIDFGMDPFDDPEDTESLSEGGQIVLAEDNAGGSSLLSEVFAFEMLHRCELADLIKTETAILYQDPMGKITDLLVEIDGLKIGVSVTRAVGFPRDDPYTAEQAAPLLERKLDGILSSSANVAPEDAWTKQILHIIAYADQHAEAMQEAYEGLDDAVKADTLVIVTISNGDDDFLY